MWTFEMRDNSFMRGKGGEESCTKVHLKDFTELKEIFCIIRE